MEHLWQYIRRYEQQAPELYTVRADSIFVSSGELRSDNLLLDVNYGHAPGEYIRTTQMFNGYPIWQGKFDEQSFIVAANVPVSESEGYTDTSDITDHLYVTIYPDVSSLTTILAWKVTKAADIGSIADGLIAGDLVRGTLTALKAAPRRILGVVRGGDNPIPGIYFRDWQWLAGEQGVFFSQALTIKPNSDCIDNGFSEATPITVASDQDLLEAITLASSSCEDIGLELTQFVTEYIADNPSSDAPIGPQFLVRATGCCGGAGGISSAQEISSPSPEESSLIPGEESSVLEEISSDEFVSSPSPGEESSVPVEASSAAGPEPEAPTTMWTGDVDGVVSTVDPVTGASTFLGNSGIFYIRSMAFNPVNGKLYMLESNDPTNCGLWEINPATGVGNLIGIVGSYFLIMVIDLNGNAYVAVGDNHDQGPGRLYSLNLTDASTSFIGSVQTGQGQGMAVMPNGQAYYSAQGNIYPIDLPTATLGTPVAATGGVNFRDMTNNRGILYGMRVEGPNDSGLCTIDPLTGAVTFINAQGSNLAIAAPYPVQPEASSPAPEEISSPVIETSSQIEEESSPVPEGISSPAQEEISSAIPEGISSALPEEVSSAQGESSALAAEATLYTVDNTNLYTVDKVTGVKTLVGAHGAGVTFRALGWDPVSSTMYGSDTGGVIYTFNLNTGVATSLGASPPFSVLADFSPNIAETLFYTSRLGEIYETDLPTNTTWVNKGTTPGSSPGAGLGTIAGVQAYLTQALEIYPVDLDTNVYGSPVVITGATNGIRSMAYADGVMYAIDITDLGGNGKFGIINPVTGVYTPITGAGTWWNIAAVPGAGLVPETSSLVPEESSSSENPSYPLTYEYEPAAFATTPLVTEYEPAAFATTPLVTEYEPASWDNTPPGWDPSSSEEESSIPG